MAVMTTHTHTHPPPIPPRQNWVDLFSVLFLSIRVEKCLQQMDIISFKFHLVTRWGFSEFYRYSGIWQLFLLLSVYVSGGFSPGVISRFSGSLTPPEHPSRTSVQNIRPVDLCVCVCYSNINVDIMYMISIHL